MPVLANGEGRFVKGLLCLALLTGGCVPDVGESPPPTPHVVAEFDLGANPKVVPTPNDLAIDPTSHKVVVPPTGAQAQDEFDSSYLDTLSGFPYESTATVQFSGAIDPASVTSSDVVVFDVTPGQAPQPVAGVTPVIEPGGRAVDVAPPAGGWTRAHRYAVGVIGGDHGVRAAGGQAVVGSATWALVSSPSALVQCPNGDLSSPASQCLPLVDVIPSTETDPAKRLLDQTTSAIQLEQIRRGYQPLLTLFGALAGPEGSSAVVLAWTFTIVDAGEVTFDPAHQIVPFPNDILRAGGHVALPDPTTGMPPDCSSSSATAQLYCGLNTLDGFSTTASPVSANGAVDAVQQAHLDPMNPPPASAAGLLAIASTAPTSEQAAPLEFAPCVPGGTNDCAPVPLEVGDAGAPASPQRLEWRLDAPLTERTTYLAYVTTDVKDDQGKNVIPNPIFALLRLTHPIFDGVHSQVNVLTDAQARQLEPLRAALAPAFDALQAAGVPRTNVALAWTFTTQSEGTLLDPLYAFGASQTKAAFYSFGPQTIQYTSLAASAGIPVDSIGNFYFGLFTTPLALTAAGTLDTTAARPQPVALALAVPDPSKVPVPPNGYPVTIFGHGLGGDRNQFLAIANALAAQGQATIATDVVFHGDRSSCTGSGAFLSQALGFTVTDDAACANASTMKCNEDPIVGRCVARDDSSRVPCPGLGVAGPDMMGNLECLARNLGLCESDGKCEGGDFARRSDGTPVISGWNLLNLSNLFATRDNLRQQVIDLAALVHTMHTTTLESEIGGTTVKFDLSKLGYVGTSLGGILGTLFNAVSPDTNNVVLNVPGGDLVNIILEAPSFAPEEAALVANLALQGVAPGTLGFDQFVQTAQWILDPAAPSNLGWRLTHPTASVAGGVTAPNANRRALIQFIEEDQTIPNQSTLALVAAAQRPSTNMPPSFGCTGALSCYEFTGLSPTDVPLAGRHGFLLLPPATSSSATPSAAAVQLTATAQTQVATFLATGALP